MSSKGTFYESATSRTTEAQKSMGQKFEELVAEHLGIRMSLARGGSRAESSKFEKQFEKLKEIEREVSEIGKDFDMGDSEVLRETRNGAYEENGIYIVRINNDYYKFVRVGKWLYREDSLPKDIGLRMSISP